MSGCGYNEVDGVWKSLAVRDIKQGDGRRWSAQFKNDITGMAGEISFKRRKDDSDADALLILSGIPGPVDIETGEINTLLFTLTDVQSEMLPLGGMHFGLRVKLAGITTTLIDEIITVSRSNPDAVGS